MEQIIIQGLKVDTLIGVYDWERTQRTQLEIDVTLDTDLSAAMRSDDVTDTIDYAAVASHIQQLAAAAQFELLEALGHCLMDGVLARFPASRISLFIVKPGILPDARQVGVRMSRVRD